MSSLIPFRPFLILQYLLSLCCLLLLVTPVQAQSGYHWKFNIGKEAPIGASYGVTVDSAGNVYISDSVYNRIQKRDSNGNVLLVFGTHGSGNGQFNYPRGIATDAAGNIYVVDSGNNRIEKFDSKGNYLSQFGTI